MSPPRVIRVLGKRFALEAVSDPEVAVVRGGAYECLGAADVVRGRIKYRAAGADSSPDEEADTVLHELIHVMISAAGIDHAFKNHDQQETAVDQLAPVLLDTLRRNPLLVAYLVEEVPFGEEEESTQT